MKLARKIVVAITAIMVIADILFPKGALCITLKEEEELAREFMKHVKAHFEFIKDPLVVNYLNTVGQKIVSVVPHRHHKYHFYLIKKDVYNAFAGPAGHVFINSGLFEAMESEDELAGILAHEIAHVECRHISQRIERSSKIALATLAGMIAGTFLGIGGAATAAQAVTVGSVAAGQSASLAYSREDERQADQLGIGYLVKSGYSVGSLLTTLKKIRSKQWFTSKDIPTYLSTHPASEDRIAYIDTWIDTNASIEKKLSKVDPYKFQLVHTRLLALYGDESIVQRKFESKVTDYPEDTIANYGYGLILARAGNLEDAVIHLRKALEKKAFDTYILTDLGRIYFLSARYPEALNALEGAIYSVPYNPEALFYLGRTQLGLGRLNEAVFSFEKLVEQHPDYSEAFYFLGEAYGKQGDLGKAHYNLGIYYKEQGDLKNSLFHLNKALKYTNNPDKKHEIEKMLEGIKKQSTEARKEDLPGFLRSVKM